MRYLTGTFRNVFYVGETLRSPVAFAALANGRLRLAVRRKLEEVCWCRSHAHCRRWRWCVDTPPARKPNPNLKHRPPCALFCLKLYKSCCYARHSCDNNCNVVVKVAQECKFFTHFLLLFYGNSSLRMIRFLGKQTFTIERSC